MSTNPITQQTGLGELGQDVLAIHATQANNNYQLGSLVTVPEFLFSCAPAFLTQQGLPKNVQGVAGLGHSTISLPNQLSSHFGLQRQFTTCLSRYPTSKGAIIFGDAPNNMRQFHNQDIFRELAFTPLTITPQGEYNVRVNSIRINQHSVVPVKEVDSTITGSSGGTMISTSTPHMILQRSVYQAFIQVFAQQVQKQAQVKAVAPYGLCFNSNNYNKNNNYNNNRNNNNSYPVVDLVMDNNNGPVWRFSGENLMVQAAPGVTCLAVVDGGMQPRAEITIGARQLEENLLVFDLARSRVGFSSSLRSHGFSCANLFNFAGTA